MTKKKKTKILPETCSLQITGIGNQGDLMAVIVDDEDLSNFNDKIYVMANNRIKPSLEEGDKIFGRVFLRNGNYWAKPIARTQVANEEAQVIFGIVEKRDGKYYLKAADKKIHMDYLLESIGNSQDGDFVKVALAGERRFKQAHIIKNFGKFDLNKATSTLVLEKYDIPFVFNEKIKKELDNLPIINKKDRLDLSNLDLVTIDGDDSKDFDDAIWAEETPIGFNLIVAIADVAFYVRSQSELDTEAYARGNSVYLPNMVVPMLPEKLSNVLCSLQPKETRASMVCFMTIDKSGNLQSYDFKRAIIKSSARLTYKEVQEALDGKKSTNIAPVYKKVIEPVYQAYLALDKARKKRGALELVVDEIKVKVDKHGVVSSISKYESYTSNKIVEEFMVNANVAAALALAKANLPVMYRVHDKPKEEKLKDMLPLLHSLGLKLPDPSEMRPSHFNKVIEMCSKNGYAQGISDMVLRMQSQAQYSPENISHFGLGLKDYAHFTSPIRRYADLLVHRALIKAYDMPDGGGLEDEVTMNAFVDMGQHLCITERKAVSAERDITARFVSSYLQPSIGSDFDVKVTGMSTAGLFVRIASLGAEGLIPLSSMPDDRYEIALGNVEMTAERSGLSLKMGDALKAKLVEASPITGGLIFKYIDEDGSIDYMDKGNRFMPRTVARSRKKEPINKEQANEEPIKKKKAKKKYNKGNKCKD